MAAVVGAKRSPSEPHFSPFGNAIRATSYAVFQYLRRHATRAVRRSVLRTILPDIGRSPLQFAQLMKRTLWAFGVAPFVPGLLFGLTCALHAQLHRGEISGTAPALGGFVVGFMFASLVAGAIAWTLGLLVFLTLRTLRWEGWLAYSLAGIFLGAAYAFATRQDRAGAGLAFYLAAFCFFGLTASATFWAIRRPRLRKFSSPVLHATDPVVLELKAELRALDAMPIATRDERTRWYAAAERFRTRLHSDWRSIYDSLPHELEHYLSDPDIRAKDPAYAEYQRHLLSLLLTPEPPLPPSGSNVA